MCIKNRDWKLLSAVVEAEFLEIEGVDVWMAKWVKLDVGILEVPHPSYPQQRHKLWPHYIETDGLTILFAAGELSNGVWCFYVPRNGQSMQKTSGTTVNEKLSHSGLFDAFDKAISTDNRNMAADILIISGLSSTQATETVSEIISNPKLYGQNEN